MSDPILAGVTIHRDAFGDPRFEYLAALCGLADADHARGKMARLWAVCTALKTHVPPIGRIVACLGHRDAPAFLVEADLGDLLPDGRVRVRGCKGRTDWLGEQASSAGNGGRARAKTARRDARGRLLPASAGTSDHPAESSAAGPAVQQPLVPLDQPQASGGGSLERPSSTVQRSPAQEQDLDQEIQKVGGGEITNLRVQRPIPPTGDRTPIPDGWSPAANATNERAAAAARERGVVVEHALAKFVERARERGQASGDWEASWRACLLTEFPTPAPVREALTRVERERSAAAAREREREVEHKKQLAKASSEDLWSAYEEAQRRAPDAPSPGVLRKATG